MRDFMRIVQERHSSREGFDPALPVTRREMETLLEAARWAPTAHNMQNYEIVAVTERKLLESLSAIHHEVSEVFLRENYRQVALSERELRRRKTGILGTHLPAAWLRPDTKPAPDDPDSHAPLGWDIGGAAALLVVLYDPRHRAPGSDGDVLGLISLGCVMENLWLAAESLDLGFHVLSVLAEGAVQRRAMRLLSVPAHLRITYACALGRPATAGPGPRVRRELKDFVHWNHY